MLLYLSILRILPCGVYKKATPPAADKYRILNIPRIEVMSSARREPLCRTVYFNKKDRA
ncbi:hypothetical protein D1BOALGB6SA_2134 [Olavius sp. associated proteobacterium Delta 1]|nr:hypothetical protein D1BOALGB6SA_2134 [Olavius sp. associated proteobacterium Delta 1]